MTDYDNDEIDLEDTEDERTVTLDRTRIRSLERDAKTMRKTTEENNLLKRELAFVKAGIDPDDPKLKYFAKGYDGDINADAIRAAATEAGFLTAPETTEDAAATERVAAASAGATSQPKTDPVEELKEAARTGGRAAVLDKIREHGHNVIT